MFSSCEKLGTRNPALVAIALAAGLLLVGLVGPRGATAGQNMQLLMEDEHHLLEGTRGEQLRLLDQMKALGVDKVRVVVWWRYVLQQPRALELPTGDLANPAAPIYDPGSWEMLDSLVRESRARGIDLVLDPASASAITGTVLHLPAWARLPSGAPRIRQFTRFVKALGRRYSGHYVPPGQARPLPTVREWSLWNEPNSRSFLAPQWRKIDGEVVAWSPVLYRRIYTAGARALRHNGHRDDRIYFGETAATGLDLPLLRASMAPATFVRELTCLDSDFQPYRGAAARRRDCQSYRRLDTDGLATHFYSAGAGTAPATPAGADPSVWVPGDPTRPSQLLDRIAARGRLPANLPVYNTEAGFQSHPIRRPLLTPEAQARNLNVAEYLQWRDSRVASFAQYLMYDDPFWYSGLRFIDGPPKPAYFAFRMPLVVRDLANGQVEIWGASYGRSAGRLTTILANGLPVRLLTPANPGGYYDIVQAGNGATVYQALDPLSGFQSRATLAESGL